MSGTVNRFDGGEAESATQTSAVSSVTGHIQPPAATAILFVEDEETLLAAVSTMLRKEGFSVIATADGTAAVNHLRHHADSIGTLILDAFFPGASSRDVLEEARRSRPNIPVIVTSACTENAVSSAFAGQHIDHVLRKPYRVAILLHLLRALIPRS